MYLIEEFTDDTSTIWHMDKYIVGYSSNKIVNNMMYALVEPSLSNGYWRYEIVHQDDLKYHADINDLTINFDRYDLKLYEFYSTGKRSSIRAPCNCMIQENSESTIFEEIFNIYSNLHKTLWIDSYPSIIGRLIEQSNNEKINFAWYSTGLQGFINGLMDDDSEIGFNDFISVRKMSFEGYIMTLNHTILWEMYNNENS